MDRETIEITLDQKIFIVKCYYMYGENTKNVRDQLRRRYQIQMDDKSVLNDIILAFENSGSVASSMFYYTAQGGEPSETDQSPDSFWIKGDMIHEEIIEEEVDEYVIFPPKEDDHVGQEPDGELIVLQDSEEEEVVAGSSELSDEFLKEEIEEPESPDTKPKRSRQRTTSCKECTAGFATHDELRKHQLKEHKNQVWICDVCGKVSNQKRIHVAHQLVHSDEKPHACEDCPMRFVRLQGLKRHRLTHTGEKPYSCDYCGQRFAAFMSHQMHVRLHTGERPHVCTHCGEKFIGLPALNVR